MADDDKPLHVSADDQRKAASAGVWVTAGPHERDRLRAGTLAALVRMANAEHEHNESALLREALEARRLTVLLAQHIDEDGV